MPGKSTLTCPPRLRSPLEDCPSQARLPQREEKGMRMIALLTQTTMALPCTELPHLRRREVESGRGLRRKRVRPASIQSPNRADRSLHQLQTIPEDQSVLLPQMLMPPGKNRKAPRRLPQKRHSRRAWELTRCRARSRAKKGSGDQQVVVPIRRGQLCPPGRKMAAIPLLERLRLVHLHLLAAVMALQSLASPSLRRHPLAQHLRGPHRPRTRPLVAKVRRQAAAPTPTAPRRRQMSELQFK